MADNVSQVGMRGFVLAKYALWLGALFLILGFIGLMFGKLSGEEFVGLGWVAGLLAGVGPAGHQAGNFAERWKAPTQ